MPRGQRTPMGPRRSNETISVMYMGTMLVVRPRREMKKFLHFILVPNYYECLPEESPARNLATKSISTDFAAGAEMKSIAAATPKTLFTKIPPFLEGKFQNIIHYLHGFFQTERKVANTHQSKINQKSTCCVISSNRSAGYGMIMLIMLF
jgi:hypothetical protein